MSSEFADALTDARAAWNSGDIALTERLLRAAPDGDLATRHELLGNVAYAREDVGLAVKEYVRALTALAKGDPRLPAFVVRVARLATLTFDTDAIGIAREAIAQLRPSDEQFAARLWIARVALLEGDATRAWTETREAEKFATVDGAFAAVRLTQATILRASDDVFGPRVLIGEAAALLASVDPDALSAPLRDLVRDLAATDQGIAVDIHRRSARRRGARGQGVIDRFEIAVSDRIAAAANANRFERHALLERAFVVFDTGGFVVPAASIALELFEDARPEYLSDAMDLARGLPGSWLERRIRSHYSGVDDDRVASLTPAQRDTLYAICAGKSANEIAANFGRSPFTIRNHTKEVFRKFGLRSRAALIAECARTGIYPPRDGARAPRIRRRANTNGER
jgi:DNA-binding CsgD family transcriptional regulator